MITDMAEIQPVYETKRYSVCPWCNSKGSPVDHLIDGKFDTTWYCDRCGESYALKFDHGRMWIGKVPGRRSEKTLVLLRHGSIGLIVEGLKHSEDPTCSGNAYFYNEHTCPTNYLKYVKRVIDLKTGDTDPHGIFQYVCTRPYDERIEDLNLSDEELAKLIGVTTFLALPA